MIDNVLQSNIFISATGDAVISDFGLSEMVIEDSNEYFSTSWYAAGSQRWMAPELLDGTSKTVTKASDIYAFGMTALVSRVIDTR